MLNAFRPLLLIAALFLAGPAPAQDLPDEPRSQREDAGDRVRQVEREGGRVLEAEPMLHGGRETYRIKVLTPEGRVRVLDDRRSRDARDRDDRQPLARPGRFDVGRDDSLDPARQSPLLRDRQRLRAPEVHPADPPPDAGEPPR